MKTLLLLIIGATAGLVEPYTCDIPTLGCTNGMFNQAKCECECISPFCLDMHGDCLNPSNNCGGNPWAECTRGVNCPWWVNPLKAESCTTGPNVPVGLWEIFSDKTPCCNSNFAYSTTCDVKPPDTAPTKFPTIAAPEGDDFEIIPIKFDMSGLPENVKMNDLKVEMTTVLKRILVRLAGRINGLKVTNVEEKVVSDRKLEKLLRIRALQGKDVTLYFNVYVVREEGKKFGPIIIREIRDSYDEVLEQIQTFTDTSYFGAGNLDMNWCTSENGKFELCVKTDTPPPVPAMGPSPFVAMQPDPASPNKEDGLAGWVIALIIIIILLLLCCMGYFIFVSCNREDDDDEKQQINNNIYLDDNGQGDSYYGKNRGESKYERSQGKNRDRGGGSIYDQSRGGRESQSRGGRESQSRGGRESRSRRSRQTHNDSEDEDEVQIVLAEPQDPKFDDDSFTINTYSTTTKKGKKGGAKSIASSRKQSGRDPTSYVPGQEDRPDPEDSVLMIEGGDEASGRRYYAEDPPLKPKRDPTMYVNGEGKRDPTMYADDGNYSMEDPPLKPKRDPTMYVEGQHDPSMYGEGQQDPSIYNEGGRDATMYDEGYSVNQEGYSVDPYGMGGIDEGEEYDDFGFKQAEIDAQYNDNSAEFVRGRKEPSYYNGDGVDGSFRTQDPSVSAKSSRSKKPKKSKSKKSSRSAS